MGGRHKQGGQIWPRGDGGQARPGLGRTPVMLDATGRPCCDCTLYTLLVHITPPHDMADAGGRMEVESRGSDTLVPSAGL